jgi:enterochelin esterase-like enzyme
VKAPSAQLVILSSTPIMNALGSADDSIALQKEDNGLWSLTIGPLPPNIYDYVYVIDGTSFTDPNNASVQTGLSSPLSLLTVPGKDEPMYFQNKDVPHGTVHQHTYKSDVIGDVRHVTIYTPPGYEKDIEKSYPVLYLLHGGGDDDRGWTLMGRVHVLMDNLLANGEVEPMVIVMPLGQAVPRSSSWDTQRHKNTPLFEQDLFAHVIPFAESYYRIKADRDHRAMAGLSMGGGQTEQIGLNHLDTFSHIGILSTGVRNFAERHSELINNPKDTNAQLNLLFLGCGTLDMPACEGMEALHELLKEKRIEHVYWTLEGAGHTWIVWRTALYFEFLPRLWRA